MAINLTALNNITPFEVNTSLINESSTLAPNLISNANTLTNGYFGLGIMMVLFIFLMIILMQDNEVFKLRFSQALNVASGLTLLLGIVMFISNLISSYQHLMWFAIIFMISLLLTYYEKN